MKFLLLVLSLVPLLRRLPASAALPLRLAGPWQQRQVAFVTSRVLSQEQQEQLNDSATAVLNAQLRRGQTVVTLTLTPPGGYAYTRSTSGAAPVSEAGTCRWSRDTLYLRPPSAGSALPPALRVVRLTRQVLVLAHPWGNLADGVSEQFYYHRP